MKSDFTNAQVGDKVWALRYGWGKVEEIREGSNRPLLCHFPKCGQVTEIVTFSCEGKSNTQDLLPSLFHSDISKELEALIPPPPKRMVDKEKEAWAILFWHGGELQCYAYLKREKATLFIVNSETNPSVILLTPEPVPFTIPYKEEE